MQQLKDILQELEKAKIEIDRDATAPNYLKWAEISSRFRNALAICKEKGNKNHSDK